MSYLSKIAVAGALAVGLTGAASAATLSVVGGADKVLSAGFAGVGYTGTTGGLIAGDTVKEFAGAANLGLFLVGKAKVIFTLLGYEAGAKNVLKFAGTTVIKRVNGVGDTYITGLLNSVLIDYGFATSPGDIPLGLNNALYSSSSTRAIALFDDGRSGPNEPDYDDLVVQIDVAPIPVPAAGLMLVGALGGLAALRRRKAKA